MTRFSLLISLALLTGHSGFAACSDREANMIDIMLAGGAKPVSAPLAKLAPTGPTQNKMVCYGGIGMGSGGGRRVGDCVQPSPSKNSSGMGTNSNLHAARKLPELSEFEVSEDTISRTASSILGVIKSHYGGFCDAYEERLRGNPDLGGKVSFKFRINPRGDIVWIALVSSNTSDTELDDQIKDQVRRMSFDRIQKGYTTVTYWLRLESSSQDSTPPLD